MLVRIPLALTALVLLALTASSAPAQDATGKEIAARIVQRPLAGSAAVLPGATARPAPATPAEKLPQRQVTPLPQAVLVPGGRFNPPPQKFYAWRYKAEDAPALAVVWSVPAAGPVYFTPGALAQGTIRAIGPKLPALRPEEQKITPAVNPAETQAFDYTIVRANAPLPATPFAPVVVPDPFKNVREVQIRQLPPDLEGPAWVTGLNPSPIAFPVPEPKPVEKKP